MKIALAQINTLPGKIAENSKKILDNISKAKQQGAGVVLFPELTIPSYAHLDLITRTEYVTENLNCLNSIANEVTGISAVIGFVDCGAQGELYNSAAVIENKKIIKVIDKTYLPNYNIFYEKRYFVEGKRQGVFKLGDKTFGLGICEDVFVGESSQQLYANLKQSGAEILLNIAASPFWQGKRNERIDVIKSIISEIKLPFAFCNLVGSYDLYDGEIVFDGHSLALSSKANLLSIGSSFEEDLLLVDFDVASEANYKEDQISETYNAIIFGIREFFKRHNLKTAIIGLSGGIDSSLLAYLAVKALGASNVIGITMPSEITSKETKSDAYLLAKNLNFQIIERPIVNEYQAWLKDFNTCYEKEPKSITKQNKQARIRGMILMEVSNETPNSLVLAPGNKSEIALGYCTLYGDMVGGLAPINDLLKTDIYKLANYVNKLEVAEIIPKTVILRAPTAELEENQTDAANLPGEYSELDPILESYVEQEESLENILKSFNKQQVYQTIKLVNTNEFKRRQAPPGIKIKKKSFGVGRRYGM